MSCQIIKCGRPFFKCLSLCPMIRSLQSLKFLIKSMTHPVFHDKNLLTFVFVLKKWKEVPLNVVVL